jgi:hypothetical protein
VVSGELKWWLKVLSSNTPQRLRHPLPRATLVADASPWGWGASLQSTDEETFRVWDAWTKEQKTLISNHKEFLAVLFALTCLIWRLPQHSTIRILSDNTSVVYTPATSFVELCFLRQVAPILEMA